MDIQEIQRAIYEKIYGFDSVEDEGYRFDIHFLLIMCKAFMCV